MKRKPPQHTKIKKNNKPNKHNDRSTTTTKITTKGNQQKDKTINQ